MIYPISPHLSIYKPQVGSMTSIFERITGVILLTVCIFVFLGIYLKNLLIFDYYIYSSYFLIYKSSLNKGAIYLFWLVLLYTYHLLFSFRYVVWSLYGGEFNKFKLNLAGLYESTFVLITATAMLSLVLIITL